MYIRALTEKDFRLQYSDMLHLLPFLIHFFLLAVFFHFHSADYKRKIMETGGLFTHQFWHAFYSLLHIYILLYTLAAIAKIVFYQKRLNTHTLSRKATDLSWIKLILAGFFIKWSCDVIYHVAAINSPVAEAALLISRIVLFLFINILIYKALRHPGLLQGKDFESAIRKATLSDMSKETYLQKLLNYMESEKPYLDPELRFEQLSARVGIPPRSLTIVINDCLNQNFYDFINSYRVKESTRILLEKDPRYKTILEVLFEVGFNNKASFNNAFKKQNGMTPSAFRRLQISRLS
jgi:AraC-like DNA-binding protein